MLAFEKRGTVRSVSNKLGVSLGTVHNNINRGVVIHDSNSIEPFLTVANECKCFLCAVALPDGTLVFKDRLDEAHVDEKWFCISKVNVRSCLVPGKERLHRTCKHKSHNAEVMFLSAVARPRFDDQSNCAFTGMIELRPFVEQVSAQRDSVDRPAGTTEMKSIDVVNAKGTHGQHWIEKVLLFPQFVLNGRILIWETSPMPIQSGLLFDCNKMMPRRGSKPATFVG